MYNVKKLIFIIICICGAVSQIFGMQKHTTLKTPPLTKILKQALGEHPINFSDTKHCIQGIQGPPTLYLNFTKADAEWAEMQKLMAGDDPQNPEYLALEIPPEAKVELEHSVDWSKYEMLDQCLARLTDKLNKTFTSITTQTSEVIAVAQQIVDILKCVNEINSYTEELELGFKDEELELGFQQNQSTITYLKTAIATYNHYRQVSNNGKILLAPSYVSEMIETYKKSIIAALENL